MEWQRGRQYTSVAFGRRCGEAGVRPSMGSVGDAYGNAMAESFFSTLEAELPSRRRFAGGGADGKPSMRSGQPRSAGDGVSIHAFGYADVGNPTAGRTVLTYRGRMAEACNQLPNRTTRPQGGRVATLRTGPWRRARPHHHRWTARAAGGEPGRHGQPVLSRACHQCREVRRIVRARGPGGGVMDHQPEPQGRLQGGLECRMCLPLGGPPHQETASRTSVTA